MKKYILTSTLAALLTLGGLSVPALAASTPHLESDSPLRRRSARPSDDGVGIEAAVGVECVTLQIITGSVAQVAITIRHK